MRIFLICYLIIGLAFVIKFSDSLAKVNDEQRHHGQAHIIFATILVVIFTVIVWPYLVFVEVRVRLWDFRHKGDREEGDPNV